MEYGISVNISIDSSEELTEKEISDLIKGLIDSAAIVINRVTLDSVTYGGEPDET